MSKSEYKQAVRLGKKYLAEHEPEIKIIYDGKNVPQLAIKSNRPNTDYFIPDISSIYAQVHNYFIQNSAKQRAKDLAELLRDKAEQLNEAAITLDDKCIQACIRGCLECFRSYDA